MADKKKPAAKKAKASDAPARKRGRPRAPAATDFGRWMDRNDLSADTLATIGQCSQTSINGIRRGLQLPSLPVAARLVVYSRSMKDSIDVTAFFPS